MTRHMHKTGRIIFVLLAALALLLGLAPQALAAPAGPADTVEVGEDGAVTLLSAHAAAEKVSSFQLRIAVEPLEGASVGFTFDGGLGGRLTNYSYRDGMLNLYIAGTAPLLADGQTQLPLGVISGGDMQSVQLPEDALQYVYGRRVIAQSAEVKSAGGERQDDPEPTPEGDARSALRAAIDRATETFGQDAAIRERYTPDSWEALQNAIIAASEVLNDPNAGEEALSAALTALNDAINGLRFAGRAALETALEQAKAYDPSGYTQDSFAQLLAAIQNAEAVLSSADTAEAEWSGAVTQLEEAMAGLVPVAQADGNGPVIHDGPDSGTGAGSAEPGVGDGGSDTAPAPVPSLSPTFAPTSTEAPSAVPTDTPVPSPSAAPTASPAPSAVPYGGQQSAPDTGDDTSVLPWMLLLCLSSALLALLGRRGRENG